jgi:hypothetical protein
LKAETLGPETVIGVVQRPQDVVEVVIFLRVTVLLKGYVGQLQGPEKKVMKI